MDVALLKKIDVLEELLKNLPSHLPLDPPESTFTFGIDKDDLKEGGVWTAINRNLERCFQRHLHANDDFLTIKYRSSKFGELILMLKEAASLPDKKHRQLIFDKWINEIYNAALDAGATLTSATRSSSSSNTHDAHDEYLDSDVELVGSDIDLVDSDLEPFDIDLIGATTERKDVLGEHIQCTQGSSQDSFTSDAVPHTFHGRNAQDLDSNGLSQGRLFFPKLTGEAAAAFNKEQFRLGRARSDAFARRKKAEDAAKVEKKRESARNRVQKHRDLKRAAKEVEKSGCSKQVTLTADGTDSDVARVDVASISHEATGGWKGKRTGKKGGRASKSHVRVNWYHPFIWQPIGKKAIQHDYSATSIVNALQREQPALFSGLHKGTVQKWLAPRATPGTPGGWTAVTLANVARSRVAFRDGNAGALAAHPDIVELAKTTLTGLRTNGIPLSVYITRTVLLAIILENKPEILDNRFKCSDRFTCDFLANVMGMTPRRGTRAAAHIPPNADEVCERAFFRLVNVIKVFEIPLSLVINMDQTGIVYIPGFKSTYEKKNSKQVSIIGKDEKRAFTLCVSSTAAGQFLPFQLVFGGKTARSCPSAKANDMKRALSSGLRFTPAASVTSPSSHYSTLKTMIEYMCDIFRPHYERILRSNPKLPRNQRAVLFLDAYPVHTGQEFLAYLRKEHPYVLPIFVPANCTGVFQPADVGLQRVIKHMIRQFLIEAFVDVQCKQLSEGTLLEDVKFATAIGVLRDASVAAVMNVFDYMNTDKGRELILMAWRKCAVKSYNLSEDKLLDPDIRLNKLEDYLAKDDTLSREIAERRNNPFVVTEDTLGEQQDEGYDESNEDDSSIPLSSVIEMSLKIRIPARCSKFCTHPSTVKENDLHTHLIPSAEEEDIFAFNASGILWGENNLPLYE